MHARRERTQHRIIFNVDWRIQHAQEVYDNAARFRPSCWIFVGPGSESTWKYDRMQTNRPNGRWDQKTLQILHTNQESGHPVIPVTTFSSRVRSNGKRKLVESAKPSVHLRRDHEVHGKLATSSPHHSERKQLSICETDTSRTSKLSRS